MVKDKNKNFRFWILIGVLLFGGVFINWFQQRGEARVERKSLSELPVELGEWKQRGEEIRFDANTEDILRTSDYTMREYLLPSGQMANVYIGYYSSQRTGATYHSPQNCVPGAGWVLKKPELIEITTAVGKTFEANRYIIENGNSREVLIYWYQGRGRAVASEYNDKIYTVWDSILRQRSDGAMIRVLINVGDSEAKAEQSAAELSARLVENLDEFVPN